MALRNRIESSSGGSTASRGFSAEAKVEVHRDDKGFHGAWYEATIVRSIARHSCSVEYSSLVFDEDPSKPLREIVRRSHVHPCPRHHSPLFGTSSSSALRLFTMTDGGLGCCPSFTVRILGGLVYGVLPHHERSVDKKLPSLECLEALGNVMGLKMLQSFHLGCYGTIITDTA